MGSRFLKDAAAFLLACAIGAAFAQYHYKANFDPHIVWDGFTLPGYDAHIYVAMAEEPRFFTVGPWGYRILLPGLIGSLLPPRFIVPGFEWVARVSLVAAGGLLLIYLRLRGATLRAALAVLLMMMAAPPVVAVFDNPFLVEPFALALMLLALIAIEGEASTAVVALSLLVLSLSKEIWVFLLPLIFLREFSRGFRSAAFRTVQAAAPAVVVSLVIRFVWTPQGVGDSGRNSAVAALRAIVDNIPVFAPDFLLGGLGVAALLALYRQEARLYLRDHALTIAPILALPLFAASYNGEGAAPNFFHDDVNRLLIYAIPFAAALAVHLDPGQSARRPLRPRRAAAERLAMVLIAVLLLAPLGFDRYSRADLSTSRDGPYLLGTVRESLRIARRLERGDTVIFDPGDRQFAWGVSPPQDLAKLRFFLRQGFGPTAHYGLHDIRMRDASATLLVPIFDPRPLKMTLHLDAEQSTWITFRVKGAKVGEALVGPQPVAVTLDIAQASLFRGDNTIELLRENGAMAGPRILRIELRQPLVKP